MKPTRSYSRFRPHSRSRSHSRSRPTLFPLLPMTEGVLDPVMIITVPASTSFPVLHPRSKESKIPRGESKFPNTGALTWEIPRGAGSIPNKDILYWSPDRKKKTKQRRNIYLYIYLFHDDCNNECNKRNAVQTRTFSLSAV